MDYELVFFIIVVMGIGVASVAYGRVMKVMWILNLFLFLVRVVVVVVVLGIGAASEANIGDLKVLWSVVLDYSVLLDYEIKFVLEVMLYGILRFYNLVVKCHVVYNL